MSAKKGGGRKSGKGRGDDDEDEPRRRRQRRPARQWCLRCEDRPPLMKSDYCGLCARDFDPGAVEPPDDKRGTKK